MDDIKQSAYIKTLVLNNFKKYNYTTIHFNSGLNLLVGPNNSGKSSILEALDICLGERNLSPLSVKRSFFHNFERDKNNKIKIVLEITFPENCGSAQKQINFIKQLKTGKNSSRSTLPYIKISKHLTIDEIAKENIPDSDDFQKNAIMANFQATNIFLSTEISVDENNNPEVSYEIFINTIDEYDQNCCHRMIGITANQRSSIFNYLLIPSNRSNNKSLIDINEFNWLGKYLKGLTKKNDLYEELDKYSSTHSYPSILDIKINEVLQKLYSLNEKISLNLINQDDSDSVITNAKFYISDGYNDELDLKAQGIQSAAIISLFSGWCNFKSSSVPQNNYVNQLWNTVLALEEPESHFHFPVKNKLMKLLHNDFLKNGAQIILSTHDSSFINWNYISNSTLIFPNSLSDKKIVSLDFTKLSDEYMRRFIRFNGHSLFSDSVLLVEGQEEICLDLLFQIVTDHSIEETGTIITRCVGKTRKNSQTENSDKAAGGGKDDIGANVHYFRKLNIKVLSLLDIDVLFDNGKSIKKIYKEITGHELSLEGEYSKPDDQSYRKLRDWWLNNKENADLKKDINHLNSVGIFFFPGDFESLFTDEYIKKFEKNNSNTDIIKEKFTYDTKINIETDPEQFISMLTTEGQHFLKDLIKEMNKYIEKQREIHTPDINILVDESSKKEEDLPWE